MRIDFVITELFVGGAERCLTELAIGLHRRGDSVRVFSIGSLPAGPRASLADRLRAAGIPVDSADADSVWQFASARRSLRRWFAESRVDARADVCQTFLFHANVLGTSAARAAGINVCVGGLRVAERHRIRLALERRATASMDSLVCVSDAVETFASQWLRPRRGQTIVIPNAVDVEHFADGPVMDWTDLGWDRDAVVTLFVGRMAGQKGIELLQQQVDAIAPAGSPCKLLMVGDGPLGSSIDDWCRAVGRDRVRRLPWQPDVAPLMRACRALVLASRYEGMPNVVMEAMAAARPVVCSRVEGTSELFADGDVDDQLFRVGDGPAMRDRIIRFQNDASLADRVGRANQVRMRDRFSIDSMVQAYRDHYRRLLARRLDED